MKKFLCNILFILFIYFIPSTASAFGVLTHEAIIDASWDEKILPLLIQKYSSLTKEQVRDAHAYAYGGAVAPDMGYYPFGSQLFTNLVHYVRSGDMVEALLRDASNVNEYAFALGFLSHYDADNYGHPMATNVSVPIVYPKMEKKYGHVVTYSDNKISHMRMEFGFDVLEVAKGNYASDAYHDFIGFKVDTALLAKAFSEIYGLDINDVFHHHFSLAVETFRWVVANIFPTLTKTAWSEKSNYIRTKDSSTASKKFKFKMRSREYDKQFGKGYKRPGFSAKLLSFFIRALPKVGPLKALKFKAPTKDAEKLFIKSFDTILSVYAQNLKELPGSVLSLKDIDFDTGSLTADCEYPLADETYCDWLMQLNEYKLKTATPAIKQNIRSYFHLSSKEHIPVYRGKKCMKFGNACRDLMTSD